jgi:hypothetical protein
MVRRWNLMRRIAEPAQAKKAMVTIPAAPGKKKQPEDPFSNVLSMRPANLSGAALRATTSLKPTAVFRHVGKITSLNSYWLPKNNTNK